MTVEKEQDLLEMVQHNIPNDFKFLGNVWAAKLLLPSKDVKHE